MTVIAMSMTHGFSVGSTTISRPTSCCFNGTTAAQASVRMLGNGAPFIDRGDLNIGPGSCVSGSTIKIAAATLHSRPPGVPGSAGQSFRLGLIQFLVSTTHLDKAPTQFLDHLLGLLPYFLERSRHAREALLKSVEFVERQFELLFVALLLRCPRLISQVLYLTCSLLQ